MRRFSLVFSLVTLTCLAVALPVAADERSRPDGIDVTPVGTHATGVYDQGAAEIVAHDPSTSGHSS